MEGGVKNMIKKWRIKVFGLLLLICGVDLFLSWFTLSYYYNNELGKVVSNITYLYIVEFSYVIVVFWVKISRNCHFWYFSSYYVEQILTFGSLCWF